MITKSQILALTTVLLFMLTGINPGYALEGNKQVTATVSIHEVAMQIRRYKSWQILDASPRQKDTGIPYFRFKLLRSDGTVKIINIDPRNPNLRRLE